MQIATVTLGLLVGLTTAYSRPRHQHFVYRRQNTTNSVSAKTSETSGSATLAGTPTPILGTGVAENPAGPQLTTLTVKTTSVRTIISCAPTITNCPAANNTAAVSALPSGAVSTVLVTDTVVLTEVVCPVTEASSIRSSVISKALTGGIVGSTVKPTADISITATAIKPAPTPKETVATSVVDVVSSSVVTMTLGGGGGQGGGRVVTTTITTHIKSTMTKTIKRPRPTNGGSSGGQGGSGSGSGSDSTVTGTKTMTGVKTVTVSRGSGTATETISPINNGPGSGSGGSGSGSGSGAGAGSCNCPAQATVTLPAETVYITMTAPAGKPTFPNAGGAADVTTKPAKPTKPTKSTKPAKPSVAPGSTGGDESACPPDDVVTATVVPFPAGNSTLAGPTGTRTGTRISAPSASLKPIKKGSLVY